jgi:hypothetical protein
MTNSATRAQLGHDWIRQLNRHALNRPRKARMGGGILKNKGVDVLVMGKIHVIAFSRYFFFENKYYSIHAKIESVYFQKLPASVPVLAKVNTFATTE